MSKGVFYLQGKYLSMKNGFTIVATWALNSANSINKLADLKKTLGNSTSSFVDLESNLENLRFEDLIRIHFAHLYSVE